MQLFNDGTCPSIHISRPFGPERLLTHCGPVTPYICVCVSTMDQVMACCLSAPSPNLNPCWPIFKAVLDLAFTWEQFHKCSWIHNMCSKITWWRHHMETFSALLAICAANSSVIGEFPAGKLRGALVFSLIWAWMNGRVKTREAGDLRRHWAHYDVTVMTLLELQPHPRGQ